MAYIGKSPTGTGVRSRYYFTATAGATSLSGADDNSNTLVFSDGNYVDVSLNGIALVAGTDYNTSTANTIAGLSALSASDIVEVVVYDIFTVADTVSAKDGGTFSGGITVAGDLTVDTTTFHVDSTNNRVGLGTVSPSQTLHLKDETSANIVFEDTTNGIAGYVGPSANNQSDTTADRLGIRGEAGIAFSSGTNTLMRMSSGGSLGIGAATDQAIIAAAEPLVVTADGSSVGTNEVAHFAYPQTSGGLYGMRLRQVVTSGVVNHTFATYNNGTEYASNLVLEGGQVAIGGSSPAFQLDVRGDVAGNYLAYFFNDGNNANRYGVLIQAGTNSGSGTLVGFNDGNGTGVGGITFSGGTVTYGAFTAQHPCIIPDADNDPDSDLPAYPYGTLLETTSLSYIPKSDGTDSERGIRYNVRKTQTANSKAVLGVYGCSMNGGPENQTNEHQALVLGDGHILCNNSGGNIEMGDGICSSAAAGIGQKATANPSMIIGIAQEAVTFSSDTETKLVAVQYGLQQFIPWS